MRRRLQSDPGRRESERWLSELCTERGCTRGIFGLSVDRTFPIAYRSLLKSAIVVAIGTTLTNVAVWQVANVLGRMTIGVGEVVLGSLIGWIGAVFVLFGLTLRARSSGRLTVADVNRQFVRLGVVVLVLYALGPISAALAPYREGAEKFNLTTVIATEAMHLVSGVWILRSLRLGRLRSQPI